MMKKEWKQLVLSLLILVSSCAGWVHGQSQSDPSAHAPNGSHSTESQFSNSISAPENQPPLTGQMQNGLPPISSESTQLGFSTGRSQDRNQPQQPYRLMGRYHLEEGGSNGYLVLQVELAEGAYIHSLTQDKEMNPSVINVKPTGQLRTNGSFLPDRNPTVIENDPVFECRMEKHTGKIQFFVPIEIQPGTNLQEFNPTIIFSGQVCSSDGVCIPLKNQTVPAKFSGYFQRTARKENPEQK